MFYLIGFLLLKVPISPLDYVMTITVQLSSLFCAEMPTQARDTRSEFHFTTEISTFSNILSMSARS